MARTRAPMVNQMKRAYLAVVLDLSLPPRDDPAVVKPFAAGLRSTLRLLEVFPLLRLEVALSGATTAALMRYGEERAVQMVAERASSGQISFLSTACFGAFLPLVPGREAARQLTLNDRLNREALGAWVYRATGLFPPQLGYSRRVAQLAIERGLSRIVVDDLSYRGGYRTLPRDRHFTLPGTANFHVFFADRALSVAVCDGSLVDPDALRAALGTRRRTSYAVVRVPGRMLVEDAGEPPINRLLTALGSARSPVLAASLQELLALFPEVESVEPLPSALGTDPAELAAGIQFARWSAPGNELHALLWRLAQIASAEAERQEQAGRRPGMLRALLDESLDCATWRYASGHPELEPAAVLAGADRLLAAIEAGGRPAAREEARQLLARLRLRLHELSLSQRGPREEAHVGL